MAILKASEKLKILALGKATLKEINELEKQAEGESNELEPTATGEKEPTATGEKETEQNETEHSEGYESKPAEETDASVSSSVEDEKDKRIEELEAKVKQLQADNVHEDNSGNLEDPETALLNIFKDFK